MATSTIEWTEKTWNPIAGCTPVSPGCLNCYAAMMATRLAAMGQRKYDGTAEWRSGRAVFTGIINLDETALAIPCRVKKPTVWFVNSLSDLFHEGVPQDFRRRIFATMNESPQHQFQILTKRPQVALDVAADLTWTPNIWMGTTVENSAVIERAAVLSRIPAAIKFLSVEPMLGPIPDLPLDGIHWVIIGCESGPKKRPFENEWAVDVIEQCRNMDVAVFVKQVIVGKRVSHDPAEWSTSLRVREYPEY
ncbi:phage Gp37/Gp68 family protein [Planctomycetales bacterium ZRK34]|nr:phage Gp37/Gp68 family protein [Planctomycetales bacterium ZRK34]